MVLVDVRVSVIVFTGGGGLLICFGWCLIGCLCGSMAFRWLLISVGWFGWYWSVVGSVWSAFDMWWSVCDWFRLVFDWFCLSLIGVGWLLIGSRGV